MLEESKMFTKLSKLKAHEQSFFALMIAIGVIALWRGVWGLLDEMDKYVFPKDPHTGFLVSIAIGLIILGLTHYTVKELM